jgi:hypothetical protein
MKSALFVQANVAVNAKLTSINIKGALFVWKFPSFLKTFGQKRAISVWYDGKIFLLPLPPPVANICGKIFLGALFNTLKCP